MGFKKKEQVVCPNCEYEMEVQWEVKDKFPKWVYWFSGNRLCTWLRSREFATRC